LLFADAILAEDAPVFAVFEDWVAMLPTPKDLEYGVGAGFGKSVKIEKPMAPYFIDAHPCNASKGAAASVVIVSAKTGAVAAQRWASPPSLTAFQTPYTWFTCSARSLSVTASTSSSLASVSAAKAMLQQ